MTGSREMQGLWLWQVTEVLKIYPKWNKILCLGVNYCIKHVRRPSWRGTVVAGGGEV